MNGRFAVRLAYRESRHGLRRVGVYMASITLGVGALVSIHSFRDDVARSIQDQAEVLMGANARLSSERPFPDSVRSVVDSLEEAGLATSDVTTAFSMVLAPRSGDVRLLQVQAVSGGYPYFGQVETDPQDLWGRQSLERGVLADPAVLTQLDVRPGDTLVIGRLRVELLGTVEDLPTDLGFQTAVGPRVYLSQAAMSAAGLLGFGSLARYEIFLRIPDRDDRGALRERYRTVFEAAQVRYTLAEEQARRLSNSVRFLGRFLALVGLAALLLGGIGVASAIHVYVRERRPGVAVLRCIGAGQWSIFAAYLIQASGLGLLGALGGVVLGSGLQRVLPHLLGGALPVEVTTRFSLQAAGAGLGIGIWVAAIFALIPLLQVRDIPPLQALRSDFEPGRRGRDPVRGAAYAALVASVVTLCVLEAPEPLMGAGFALGLGVCLGLLGGVAWALSTVTRRYFPSRASYPVRQGVSNLFRPQNQTVSVTLALGFGAFIVGTILEVERNVLDDLSLSFGQDRPNVLLFDVQPDQVGGITELLPDDVRPSVTVAPIVPSRLEAINGRTVEELRADSTREDRPERWAVRREYRNTYRAEIGPAERVVAGRWWDGTPGTDDPAEVDPGDLPRVSLEVDVARDLAVGLGDTLVWNVAGTEVASVITSLRTVDWDRLEPNFFAIFEPGSLDHAPQTTIMVARIAEPERRAAFQRSLVATFPNVSALDFSRVQEAVDTILTRVRQAVGFLGAFSVLAGVIVLVGALATSRLQRMREGALLKTLGARRTQVLGVLFAEYLALGTMATSSGLILASGASALMVPRLFEVPYAPHLIPMGGIWIAVAGVTVTVGLASSRRLLRRPPLEVLREIAE